jgi:hypothetical protein
MIRSSLSSLAPQVARGILDYSDEFGVYVLFLFLSLSQAHDRYLVFFSFLLYHLLV